MQPHSVTSRSYRCQCGAVIFLRNSQCLRCERPLGYDSGMRTLLALEPSATAGLWTAAGGGAEGLLFARCANLQTAAACNWLLGVGAAGEPAADGASRYAGKCLSCSLTRTLPDLSTPKNQEAWRRLETAKRRLVSQLLALALPVETRLVRADGMAFDMLESMPGQPRVTTGHRDGVITVDIAEADDAERERLRAAMHEPYRTLLGHFRHEIGHYYWDRLVRDTQWLEGFRLLFGDERADYAVALQHHYAQGAPADWHVQVVTAYASAHPWEDWAETWAHYLHISDSIDTAASFHLDAAQFDLEVEPYTRADLWDTGDSHAEDFLALLNSWVMLTQVLNELSRSMGQPDFSPFVLPRQAVPKLHFIHLLIRSASGNPM